MLHRSKSRLAVAGAAGTVCALVAAGAAMAGPAAPHWTGSKSAVPNVYTNATPGMSAFYETNQGVAGTFLVWKGQLDNKVQYKHKINGKWSNGIGTIPGAYTTTSPAAAFYTDPNSKASELVVWKKLRSDKIFYAQGEVAGNGSVSWTKPLELPGGRLASTASAPAVFFPLNSVHGRVIVAWRGPYDHVRYELGTPSGRGFKWTRKSHWIGAGTTADPTTTISAPALTEILSNNGNTGVIYVFWRDLDQKSLSYASVSDNFGGLPGGKSLPWELLGQVPGADSTVGPAASSIDAHGDGPLLLAYKGPSGEYIRYQTLTAGTWSPVGYVTGAHNTTTLAPALINGTLASVSPTSSGRVYLHHYAP